MRVTEDGDGGVVGVDEDREMRTAPLGAVSGALVGEISTGERWQFEAELLYPLGTGRPVGKIIDVEHHLKFRDELCLISSTTFFVHGGDRTTSMSDPSTARTPSPLRRDRGFSLLRPRGAAVRRRSRR